MNARDFVFRPNPNLIQSMQTLVGIGSVTFAAGLYFAPQRTWLNLLLISYYLLGLALAGAVWVTLQYVSGAHWSTALRRVPEAMAGLLPQAALGILAILILRPSLYPWISGLHSDGGAIGFKRHMAEPAVLSRPGSLLSAGMAWFHLGSPAHFPAPGCGRRPQAHADQHSPGGRVPRLLRGHVLSCQL